MRKLLPLLLLAGCAPGVDMTRFDPTPRPPVAETAVRFTDERPAGCTSVARLRVETDSDRRMRSALAKRAALIGANTVLLQDEDPALAMVIMAGIAGIPVNTTRFTAVALSCP